MGDIKWDLRKGIVGMGEDKEKEDRGTWDHGTGA